MSDSSLHVDSWIWGNETIIWGFDPLHKYTFKILAPKKGRTGCLSLQYHHEKSESWFQFSGVAWALLIVDDVVCTRVMHPGAVQNIETGVIHRLMGVTDDCQVLEPSTPDHHTADKNIVKDVVRLHCVLGRATVSPRNAQEKILVDRAVELTEEACLSVAKGEVPKEYNREILEGRTAFQVKSSSVSNF